MGVTSDKRGLWQAHGERAIYDSPWVWLGQVDVEPPGGARYWHHVVRLRKAAVAALPLLLMARASAKARP